MESAKTPSLFPDFHSFVLPHKPKPDFQPVTHLNTGKFSDAPCRCVSSGLMLYRSFHCLQWNWGCLPPSAQLCPTGPNHSPRISTDTMETQESNPYSQLVPHYPPRAHFQNLSTMSHSHICQQRSYPRQGDQCSLSCCDHVHHSISVHDYCNTNQPTSTKLAVMTEPTIRKNFWWWSGPKYGFLTTFPLPSPLRNRWFQKIY